MHYNKIETHSLFIASYDVIVMHSNWNQTLKDSHLNSAVEDSRTESQMHLHSILPV